MISRRILVPLVVLAAGIPLAADTVFNVVNDFNATTNPNGVWSYGESPSPDGAFTAYAFHDNNPPPNAIDYWINQPFANGFPNYYPLVRHNASGAAIDNGDGFILPTDMLSLDPSNDLSSGVRFTAPADGSYSFTGSFRGLQNLPSGGVATSSAASIYEDLGSPALVLGAINKNDELPFSFVLNLTAGATLDFRVASGGNNNGDSTGLALTVVEQDLVQGGVPEPSYAGLLAIGLACAAFVRRNSSRGAGPVGVT